MVALNPAHAVQCTQLAIKHALTGERGPVAVLYSQSSAAWAGGARYQSTAVRK